MYGHVRGNEGNGESNEEKTLVYWKNQIRKRNAVEISICDKGE